MGEYIERDALIKHIQDVYCVGCNSYHGVRCRACGTGDAIDMIEDATAADVVTVVRCKDCKHRVYKYMNEEIGEIGGCELFNRAMSNDDFCSCGERKENEDER